MNYTETLQYLYNSLPMFQRVGRPAYKSDLKTTMELDRHFNHPHRNFPSVHVAGTNGKGSVAHMLASVLQEAGYKTGLYTSPHLKDFRERIRVNGIPVPEAEVVRFVEENRPVFEKLKPSFFEMTVAMAFDRFEKEKVDIAIVEVGMGGRLDSTNIIQPLVSVITNIGHDHMEYLGSSLQEIAGEKAGIMKDGIPVIVGETQEETRQVFTDRALQKGCEIYFADRQYNVPYATMDPDELQNLNIYKGNSLYLSDLKTDLLGFYQRKNAITAIMCIEMLGTFGFSIPVARIYRGFANIIRNTGILGRWQIIGKAPMVVCDTGHNQEGIRVVVEQIGQMPHRQLFMVIGSVKDKQVESVLGIWPKDARYFFTQANIPRALDAGLLAEKASAAGLRGEVIPSIREALERARSLAGPGDLVFVGGSTFVVAEIL